MKKVVREKFYMDGLTPCKMYRIHYISQRRVSDYLMESYHVVNDYGKKVDVVSRAFRDLNTQEYRQEQLKKLGV